MAYANLKTDYQNRTAISGWRFCIEYQMKFAATCPFWFGHRKIKNRLLGELLFQKWNKRPRTSYKLYWRLHPYEYEQSKKFFRKKK